VSVARFVSRYYWQILLLVWLAFVVGRVVRWTG
jgi:hypothetical protein